MVKEKIDVEEIPNKSKTYLLPLLAQHLDFPAEMAENLLNTYLNDSNTEHKDCIYLLFNYDYENPEYIKFEDTMFKNKLFVESYDFNTKVLYVFKFPEEYSKELEHYKNSRYSKFGEDATVIVIKFLSTIYGRTPRVIPIIKKVKQVLTKAESLRAKLEKDLNVPISKTQELGEKIDLEKEVFNFNDYEADDGVGQKDS